MLFMRQYITFLIVILTLLLSVVYTANAYQILPEKRKQLEERGISLEATYTGEYWKNKKGGLQKNDTYLGNIDLNITLDTKKANLWSDGTFFVYFLDNHGGKKLTESITGDLQTISNIEAPRSTRLYQFWYEHTFRGGLVSVLLGIHDYNSDFAVTEYGGLFINSSFGISPDISSSARPSIFPLAAPAVRVKWNPTENFEWLLGVYDGNPGDPEIDEHYPRSTLDSGQGTFIASEWIYHTIWDEKQSQLPGSYKLGFWTNTGEFNDITETNTSGSPIVRNHNIGGYIIIDHMLYREKKEQGAGMFIQIGGNMSSVNEVDFYIGGGLNYRGLIPTRDQDIFGIAVAYASISDDLTDNISRTKGETTLELTYQIPLNENVTIQPDIQFVFNPGASRTTNNTVTTGLRFELSF